MKNKLVIFCLILSLTALCGCEGESSSGSNIVTETAAAKPETDASGNKIVSLEEYLRSAYTADQIAENKRIMKDYFVETYGADAEIDADGDGLPDKYELEEIKTDPNLADTDGDGVDDFCEFFLLQSDPLTPNK